jgi:adenosine kinase
VVVDPTGVGDGFRAGFLAAIASDLDLEHAAMTGAALATIVIETTGTQEYTAEPRRFTALLETTYGREAATHIGHALRLDIPAAELEATR